MKTSLKRKRQIRLIVQNRISSRITKKKKKVQQRQTAESWIKPHLNNLILRKQIDFKCEHVHVSSSTFLRFIRGNFNYRRAHGFLFARFTHGVGLAGEQAFAAVHDNFIHHPFSVSKRLPFLCATPDFILKGKKLRLVEIKTCTSLEDCKRLFDSPPLEYLFQIWISLEIFGLEEADLMVYFYSDQDKKLNRYGTKKSISLYGKVRIKLNTLLIFDQIHELAIQRFLEHFKLLFERFGEKVSSGDFKEAKEALERCFKKHKRLSTSHSNLKNLLHDRKLGPVTEDCYRLLNLNPDNLRGGTNSREEHDQDYYKNLKKCLERRKIKLEKRDVLEKTVELNDSLINKAVRGKNFLFEY